MSTVKYNPPSLPESGFSSYEEQAEYAFDRMRQQFKKLQQSSIDDRLKTIGDLRDNLMEHRDAIIDALVAEGGKTKTEAAIEFLGAADWLKWIEENAKEQLAEKKITTPILLLGKKSKIYHEALGVVLIITSWNYPLHTVLTQIISAFVCGNAVIYKPSEVSPMIGIYESLFRGLTLIEQSVFIAYGNGDLGRALINKRPNKIFFTGSTRTGIAVSVQAAHYLIPVETELGGKDAMIVFESADLERAVAAAVWGAFTHSGQSCSSVERLYVDASIYNEFIKETKKQVSLLKQAELDKDGDIDISRITVDFQYDIIDAHVKDAIEKGARVVCGGQGDRHSLQYEPTVLTNVTNKMLVMSTETFGPILPIVPFRTEEEVIKMANNSMYGLQASVFTDDTEQGERIAKQLEVGGVSINNVNMVEGNPWLSFGGRKQTGTGRARGVEGLLAYTCSKHILIDSNSNKREPNWYPYTDKKYVQILDLMNHMYSRSFGQLAKTAVSALKLEKIAKEKRK